MAPIDAIDLLMAEHQIILGVLQAVEERLRAPFERKYFERAIEFFVHYADECHHSKEEEGLFPRLLMRGIPGDCGPVHCMLRDHDTGRAHMEAVQANLDAAEAGSPEALKAVRSNLYEYLQLLRHHIAKEDTLLFQTARRILSPRDLMELAAEFTDESNPKINQAARERHFALAAELVAPPGRGDAVR